MAPGELPGASLPNCTGDLHGLASVGCGRLGEGAGPRPGLPEGALGQGPTCRRCVPPGGAAASTGPRAPARWAPRPPSARTWVAPSPSVWSAGRTASSGLRISSTGRCWARAALARPSRCGACQGGRGSSGGDLLALHPLPTSVPRKPHWKGVWLPDSLARARLPPGLVELAGGGALLYRGRLNEGGRGTVASQSRDGRAAQADPEGFLPQGPLTQPNVGHSPPSHSGDQPSPASDVICL